MSLRDSIKDLRNAARRLDAAKFNPSMNALEEFLSGIKVDKPVKPPEDLLEKLLWKFRNRIEDFSSREIRALPFIIYEPEIVSYEMITILRLMDFSRTSHLRGILSVYFLNHDDSNKTERLRRELNNVRNVVSISLRKIFAAREYLFSNERFQNMSKLFVEKLSVKSSLETLGLSNFYKTSNFIQTSLKNFFRSNVATLSDKFKILDELDAESDTYKNIFPVIADTLIQSVALTGFGKNKCLEIFYHRMGDPRFGNSRFNWNSVSQKSKDIFCHWLSEEDLEVFFKIIKQTAVDKMWRYREKFWRAYLPYIVNTKIFLGDDARNIAASLEGVKLNHGTLTKAEKNQSVFVFQIRQYIFSEWSHNGKLRVHKLSEALNLFDTTEDFFEKNSINRDVLVKKFIEEWTHYPHEGQKSWQNKVSKWLKENCGIYKTENDWGIKD